MRGRQMRWAALAGVLLGVGLTAAPSRAAAPRARVAEVPQLPTRAVLHGPAAPSLRVALTVSLLGRDPLGLPKLAAAVSSPGSADYHHYLTITQFARRFGATPARVAAVSRALRAGGLRVQPVDANHLTLAVTGSVAQVQRAFATRLARVRMASGRMAFAPRVTPTLPASIAADVDGVVGLDSLYEPQQQETSRPVSAAALAHGSRPNLGSAAESHVATSGPQPCPAALKAQSFFAGKLHGLGGYTADEIADAYDLSPLYAAGDAGAGQTVALFELEPINLHDVARFQSCYGTHARVAVHQVAKPAASDTDEESALDVEQVVSLAPQARVEVYEGGRTAAGDLRLYSRMISADSAKTISSSWGGCEAAATDFGRILTLVREEDRLFQEAAVQGQSVIAASGDTGSTSCYQLSRSDHSLSVGDPASQPYVTSVGGTSLYAAGPSGAASWNPNVPGEPAPLQSVWNDGITRLSGAAQAAASGGGISRLWKMPGYQRRAQRALRVVNDDSSGSPCRSSRLCREVPDVSADGDPMTGYLVYVTGPGLVGDSSQWSLEAGTSAAAPLWAALTALTDALPSCRGTTVGFENPSLYALAAQPGYLADVAAPSPFGAHHADNDAIGTRPALYPVTSGYDMATGLGTPAGAAVAGGLCGLRAPVYDIAVDAPRTRRAFVGTPFTVRVRGADSGRLRLDYSAHGLPRGLRISRDGVISGRARRAGRYRVAVTARDHATNTGTVVFTLRVLTPPPQIESPDLTGVVSRHPAIAFSVTCGHDAPDLRAIALRLPPGLSIGRRPRGIHVLAGRRRPPFHAARRHGVLTISLVRPASRVHIVVGRGTLFASRSIAQAARRAGGVRVPVRVTVTDTRGNADRFTLRLRLRH